MLEFQFRTTLVQFLPIKVCPICAAKAQIFQNTETENMRKKKGQKQFFLKKKTLYLSRRQMHGGWMDAPNLQQ